jgi:hypothetical protein
MIRVAGSWKFSAPGVGCAANAGSAASIVEKKAIM